MDINAMAKEAGCAGIDNFEVIEKFARLVEEATEKRLMQLFTDPENQPTQYGTVTLEYMQRQGTK